MGHTGILIDDGGKGVNLVLRNHGRAQGADKTDLVGNEITADTAYDSHCFEGLNALKDLLLGQAKLPGDGLIGPGFDRKIGLDAVQYGFVMRIKLHRRSSSSVQPRYCTMIKTV